MKKRIQIRLGKCYNKQGYNPDRVPILELPEKGWARIMVEGESRAGKSAHAKDIVVRTSHVRKGMVIFSFKGEWEKHVTHYNDTGRFGMCMDNVGIIKGFKLNLSDIESVADFGGFFGQGEKVYQVLYQLLFKAEFAHQWDVDKFGELIAKLPTAQYQTRIDEKGKKVKFDAVKVYKEKTGVEIDSVHFAVAQSLKTSWGYIKEWFAKADEPALDIEFMYNKYDHLIINVTKSDGIARFLSGILIRQLRNVRTEQKPFFVFEELSVLAQWVDDGGVMPTSVEQIYEILTRDSKYGVGFMGIVQHEDQIWNKITDHIHIRIVVGRYLHAPFMIKDACAKLKWNALTNYREALIYYGDTGKYTVYVPNWCCCRC